MKPSTRERIGIAAAIGLVIGLFPHAFRTQQIPGEAIDWERMTACLGWCGFGALFGMAFGAVLFKRPLLGMLIGAICMLIVFSLIPSVAARY